MNEIYEIGNLITQYDCELLGFILFAAAALITTVVQSYQADESSQSMKEFNSNEAQKNRNYNTEMYERQLADSDPSLLASKYKNAGLTNSAVAQMLSGGQGITPSLQSSGAQASIGDNLYKSALESMGLPLQQMNQNYQNELIKNQAIKAEEETKWIDTINQNTIDLTKSQINKIAKDNEWTNSQINQANELLPLLKGKYQTDIEVAKQSINESIAKIDEIRSNIGVNDLRKVVMKKESSQIDVQTGLIEQQKSESKSRENLNITEAQLNEYNKARAEFENNLRENFGLDPNDGLGQQIVTSVLSGKGDEVISAVLDSIDNAANMLNEKYKEHKQARKNKRSKWFVEAVKQKEYVENDNYNLFSHLVGRKRPHSSKF